MMSSYPAKRAWPVDTMSSPNVRLGWLRTAMVIGNSGTSQVANADFYRLVFSCSNASLTSRDSLIKYRAPHLIDSRQAEFLGHRSCPFSQSFAFLLAADQARHPARQRIHVIGRDQDTIYAIFDHFTRAAGTIEAYHWKT